MSSASLRWLLLGCSMSLVAAQTPAPAAQNPPAPTTPAPAPTVPLPDIVHAWDDLVGDVIPNAPIDPVLKPPQLPVSHKPLDEFGNHFFFESRTEYIRQDAFFSGLPTTTGVINAPITNIFNPAGVPYPDAFQPSANSIYELINLGTRGWLSDRLNTNFTVRYREDLTHIDAGSEFQSPITAFPAARRFELLTGEIELHGESGDGALRNSTLSVGRLHEYSTDLASFDGVAFGDRIGKVSFSVFGGRRFTYFGDPVQRAIGGSEILFRLPHNTTLEYQNLFYVKGSHRVTLRKGWEKSITASSSLSMVGGHLTNSDTRLLWFPRDGKTTLRLGFQQELTDKDYVFDYTELARNNNPLFDSLLRLNLGQLTPFSQVFVDGRRDLITNRLRTGGSAIVRRLVPEALQGPFNDSFEDYRLNFQFYPWPKIETFWEYHLRDTHRRSPVGATAFDDVTIAGETREADFRGEIRHSFGHGRLTVSAGGFYRTIDLQDRFFYLPNTITKGVIGSFNFKFDSHTRVYFNYSLDRDFYVFQPDLSRAQTLRVGLIWRY